MITRRHGLISLGAAALVAGFDLGTRRWLTHAEAASCVTFADAPVLTAYSASTCWPGRRWAEIRATLSR